MAFDDLQGKEFWFYGATEHQFKIGATVWEAEEDESDGYRSYLGSVERKVSDAIFFKRPIAKVRVEILPDENKLVDVKDGHEWLRFGTDYADPYYPYFFFDYQPKAPKKAEASHE